MREGELVVDLGWSKTMVGDVEEACFVGQVPVRCEGRETRGMGSFMLVLGWTCLFLPEPWLKSRLVLVSHRAGRT